MQVTLFSKHNCQLCDAIKYELLDLQSEYGFGLREQLVGDDPNEGEEAELRVPFVDIESADGRTVRFEFPVKQTALRRAIHAQMGRRTGRHEPFSGTARAGASGGADANRLRPPR